MTRTPDVPHAANRLGLSYRAEAVRLGAAACPLIDVHTHRRGRDAIEIYWDAAQRFGITEAWSMTPLEQLEDVSAVLGESVRFIAQPTWGDADPAMAMGERFLDDIATFHARGARIVKFWTAPRAWDIGRSCGVPDLMCLDGPWRQRQLQRAVDLSMSIMVHIADPDTWFATHYADASLYGTKEAQYEPFERAMQQFPVPWLAAHMGGWPEDLAFLDGLLSRHPMLHLDTSATKWMVRTLSRHSRDDFLLFLRRWRGRILFGSDIVTQSAHLIDVQDDAPRTAQASSPEEAFDLYASRYWALRTLFESSYEGPSPIADPDLALLHPDRYQVHDAPMLRGHALPEDLLLDLYQGGARSFTAMHAGE